MSYCHYDRLSAMDAAFLELEDGNAHMHTGSIGIFDAGPLGTELGGIDFKRILEFTDAALQKDTRFQQKIGYVPALNHPVWVDDERFNLVYHVRHACLPAPGNIRLLKRLAGRIMSEALDRGKPLWELWFVEGVEGNRFAVISKVHQCLAEGVWDVGLLSAILGRDRDDEARAAREWIPRPAPTSRRLFVDEIWRRASVPLSLLRAGGRAVFDVGAALGSVREAAAGLREAARASLHPASETPFNGELGPHRRIDWTRLDLDGVREVKKRLGGTINDIALAIVAGAVRRFFRGRGLRVRDLDFRVLMPVDARTTVQRGAPRSRLSTLVVPLPIAEASAEKRLAKVIAATREAKGWEQQLGGDVLAQLADWTSSDLLVRFARLALWNRAANMVITNVAGPSDPVYLLGSRMLDVFPAVPLAPHQALGISLLSYAGGLYWGFNSDWDAVPDLHDFVLQIQGEFEELRKAASEAAASR